MRTLFFSLLVLILFFLIYGHELPQFEDVKQNIDSVFQKIELKNIKTYSEATKELMEQDSALISQEDSEEVFHEKPEVEIMMNPIVEGLLEMEPNDVKRFFQNYIYKLEESDSLVSKYFFLAAVILFLLMLLTSKTALSRYSFFFARLGFNLSSILIFITVVITPIAWFVFKYNLFSNMNGIFFIGPMALFASSIVSLKIYDLNNPIWNRMIISFLCLTVSAGLTKVF